MRQRFHSTLLALSSFDLHRHTHKTHRTIQKCVRLPCARAAVSPSFLPKKTRTRKTMIYQMTTHPQVEYSYIWSNFIIEVNQWVFKYQMQRQINLSISHSQNRRNQKKKKITKKQTKLIFVSLVLQLTIRLGRSSRVAFVYVASRFCQRNQ